MSKLFQSTQLKEIMIPNRIVMSPMCQYVAKQDGKVTDWHKVHYGARAVGKVGLIIVEATAVEARGRITDQDLGIWNDDQIPGLKEIVDFAHKQGSVIGIQLAHAGRKAEISDRESVIAPSPIPFDQGFVIPKKMTEKEIEEVVQAFADAARRADQAGFDIIELHGAHGYLIHEFLSPLSNQRNDAYGGSREGRLKFLQEIVKAVKKVWPSHKPILLRVSATDYADGGIDLQEMIEMLKIVKTWGIDVIDVSSGGLVPARIEVGAGYQVKFAERIKEEVGIPTITVGLITEPELAEEILFNDRADFVALGRELLRDPYWPLHAAKKLNVDIEWPKPYERAKR
ncbi:NADPH dehydrogenase NamA [Tepidibacillus sp. LV47]|uniref:NADPH dehydrogenase NamA n=1 Tax=Tepidibacillus sp. LV47 TaxID=3398228 RepID=UPI003AAE3CFD